MEVQRKIRIKKDDATKHTHTYFFGKSFGGESLTLTTRMVANGDPITSELNGEGLWFNQELTLCSYANASTFHLSGTPLTSIELRQLADELDAAELKVRNGKE